MPKRSAGIFLYRRRRPGAVEVLLVHPGGPFWAKKDDGAWSIPKGEYAEGEDPLATAKREFGEETGASEEAAMKGPPVALGSFRQPSGKIIDAWAVEGTFDPAGLRSNTFTMEWPPRSGRIGTFPEVDRAEWFTLEAAAGKIIKGQRPILEVLRQRLGPGGARTMTSATYKLFRKAILEERQIICDYQGHHRELCPHIIGHTDGEEKVLAFQFAGETSTTLPPGGEWRCLYLSKVSKAKLREGPWHAGNKHQRSQTCVETIDLDVNIHVRKLRKP